MKLWQVEGWAIDQFNIPVHEKPWFGTKKAATAYVASLKWDGVPEITPRFLPGGKDRMVEWLNRYDGYSFDEDDGPAIGLDEMAKL